MPLALEGCHRDQGIEGKAHIGAVTSFGAFGHPEHVGAFVVVAVVQFGGQVFSRGVGKVKLVGGVLQPGFNLGAAGGEGVANVL